MKKRFSSIVLLIVTLGALSLSTQSALAALIDAESCREDVRSAIAKKHRWYRIVLFGQKKAENSALATVRYNTDGTIWYKKKEDEWRTRDEGRKPTPLTNEQMDDEDENASRIPIRGIFDTRRVTTSELIPYLLQTIHTLQCRIDTICEVAVQSVSNEAGATFTISIPGCEATTEQAFTMCTVEEMEHESDIRTYCSKIGADLLQREAALLKFAIEYDAAYRSFLQFAGAFDHFLREWRWTLTGTLRQLVYLIGWFDGIPCFISSCMEYPPSSSSAPSSP